MDILVIGGGAAAVAALQALSGPIGRHTVQWLAPEGEHGRGLAYSTTDPLHLLNVRAARMSIDASQPNDFVQYLDRQHGQANPHSFYPRHEYGNYLVEKGKSACSRLAVLRRDGQAQAANWDGRFWTVIDCMSREHRARRLILALGPQSTRPLDAVSPALATSPCFASEPYSWLRGQENPPNRLWVLGTGLTAVDVVLSAAQRYPQAELHMLSRHGALPTSHDEPASVVTDLLQGTNHMPTVRAMCRLLRDAGSDLPWRERVDGLRALTVVRWQRWSELERRRFLRHARWAWDRVRHRMAPEVAAKISALTASGQLKVHRGFLRHAELQSGPMAALLSWQPRHQSTTQTNVADMVVQATGLNLDLRHDAPPLLHSLISRGLARADANGLGLCLDPDLRLTDASGQAEAPAYVLGALGMGSRLECTAVPELRINAAHITTLLDTVEETS